MTEQNGISLAGKTRRFARALDHALYDRAREEEESLIFLYDADVLVKTMLGLTEWQNDDPVPADVSDPVYVVRALLSVGYLPRAHLLRPHLVEIDRFIQNTRRPEAREAGSRVRQMQFLIRRWGLNQHDLRMSEYSADAGALENFIREEGFEIFVKLELCYGGLVFDRLGRILKHCALRAESLRAHPLSPGDPFALEVAARVGRSWPRRHRVLNNLVDGYALSELSKHAQDGAPIRFYSETWPVRKLFHDPLPPGVNGDGGLRDRNGYTVLREAEYFLMRCSFPAVAFAHLTMPQGAEGPVERTIEELQLLNRRLQELVSPNSGMTDEELESALLSEPPGRESVAELMQDFYSLRFLKNVFLRCQMPPAMKEFMPYLANFFNNEPRLRRMHEMFEQSIYAVTEAFTEQIGNLARWQNDVLEFRAVIRARRKDFKRTPDPWMDLGLGRWGLNEFLSLPVREELTRWLGDVANGEKRVDPLASDLALRLASDDYREWGDFALAQCQLWSLKQYARLAAEWEENSGRFEPGVGMHVLQVLYLVARIKLIVASLEDDSEAEIARVQEVVNEAEQRMPPPLPLRTRQLEGVGLMGVAHVTYWAWKRLRKLSEALAGQMAEKSFSAAKEAMECFPPNSMQWAFALNHCVYVGTVARLHRWDEIGMWQQIYDLHTTYRNHYRFADTQAQRQTDVLVRLIDQHGMDAIRVDPALQEQLCSIVTEAKTMLAGARPFFGDEEVDDHWKRLSGYEIALGCLGRNPAGRISAAQR